MLVFKTVNILNGKVFIGSSTKNNPNFLGSSKALLKDIRKFGIKNFQREVIRKRKILDTAAKSVQ